MRFVHVATKTADPERAVRFYELLGMRLDYRRDLEDARVSLLYVEPPEGNFCIELTYIWDREEPYDETDRFHLAFEVKEIDDVYARLVEAGVKPLQAPYLLEGGGPMIAFVADPDGNQIELMEVASD